MDRNDISTPHGTKLTTVPVGKQRFNFWLNGVQIDEPVSSFVATLKTTRADFQFVYGMGPDGWDDFTRRETGGGGVGDVVFSIINRDLWIGLVEQMRAYQSNDPVENILRGYLGQNETRNERAALTAEVDGGMTNFLIFELPGAPKNTNNAFNETWQNGGDGVTDCGIFVPRKYLVAKGNTYEFKPNVIKTPSDQTRKILGCHFIHWTDSARLGDMMTTSGGYRLMAFLHDVGVLKASFSKFEK